MELKYRPDIDGLRALAVLSVVIFHLGMPLRGGFAGVDIFFTISGFLIGSIILGETKAGSFSFAKFYERRIRRIFPAMFAMFAVVSVVAYQYLLPGELLDYAHSLAAATFSVSNFYFWSQSGYFDTAAHSKPLLHTWSLAVEEQFYIFFPIFLVAVRRFAPHNVNGAIGIVGLVSFAASAYGVYEYPTATFYGPLTRAWELLLGAALALEGCPRSSRPIVRESIAAAGMAMILWSLFFLRGETPFPGIYAVPACLGTAMIIWAGREGPTITGRMLSIKPMTFMGLISYSLYLWHWPVIVFSGSFGVAVINGLNRHQSQAVTLFISVLLAIISWRFVETPFRVGKLKWPRKQLFFATGGLFVLVLAVSVWVESTDGVSERYSQRARNVASWMAGAPDQYRTGICFISSRSATLADFKQDICIPEPNGKPRLLIIGDSHAAALWWGLNETFKNAQVMQITSSGCKPVVDQRPRQHQHCVNIMDFALKEYLPAHPVDAVLIEARWVEADIPGLEKTISWLKSHHVPVVLIGPIAQYDSPLPRLLAYSITKDDKTLAQKHLVRGLDKLDKKLQDLAENEWKIPYVSIYSFICKEVACMEYVASETPIYSDYGHLTKPGSIWMGNKIAATQVLPKVVYRSQTEGKGPH